MTAAAQCSSDTKIHMNGHTPSHAASAAASQHSTQQTASNTTTMPLPMRNSLSTASQDGRNGLTRNNSNSSLSSSLLQDDYGLIDLKGCSLWTCPELQLDNGQVMRDLPVCYKTYGHLNTARDNGMFVCHALTGHACLEDWWSEMLGADRPFDTNQYFIVCANLLGSCYGTAGPTEINPATGERYGSTFPVVTVRDSVRLHNKLRQHLRIERLCAVIGGSLGGMQALEWCFEAGPEVVQCCVALACSARHSAWQIALNHVQRQVIQQDPEFCSGQYDQRKPPVSGLSIARQLAMITYRSRSVYDTKFGRRMHGQQQQSADATLPAAVLKHSHSASSHLLAAASVQQQWKDKQQQQQNNVAQQSSLSTVNESDSMQQTLQPNGKQEQQQQDDKQEAQQQQHSDCYESDCISNADGTPHFEVERYLSYQGQKMNARFDVNCYMRVTQMLDSHDVGRGRGGLQRAMHSLGQLPILTMGVDSDVLYTLEDCREIHDAALNSTWHVVRSREGHDGFLLEQQQIGTNMRRFLQKHARPQSHQQEEDQQPSDAQ